MNKYVLSFAVAGIIIAGLLAVSLMAEAASVTLSLATTGNGASVQVTVYASAYSSVTLYYQKSGYQTQSLYLGSTDSGGYLSTVIATSSSGISSGDSVYVVAGSIQSPSMTWPYAMGLNNGSLTLSQTNVSVSVGQSVNVTISGGNMPYTMYPSTTGIFQSVIGGNTLAISGTSVGSASLSVCSSGGTGSGCTTLYITVTSGNTNQQITLSQTNLSLNTGSSTNVSIYGSGNYYISSHSNSNVASAYINGSTISITGNNNGSDNITICQNYGQCVTLYVTVTGYTQPITLSQTNVSLTTGNSTSVYIYGSGNYYISSHSNSNVASAYINGNSVSVTANNYGTDNISICQTGGQCVTLYVTVTGSGQTNGNVITFSRSNPVLVTGQNMAISLYGGSGNGYYVAFNSNPNAVQTSINGSTLTLTGNSYTGAGIVVCSSSNSCGALSVSVGSIAGAETGPNTWTHCAGENNQCYFPGTQLIRYGANGNYTYRTVSGSVMCSNSVFGDPIFGTVKQCWYGGTY